MTENKNLYIYIIPYLMVCSVLYHFSYWNRFGLNGLSYISLSDIIKSAVYPIYSTMFLLIFQTIVTTFVIKLPEKSPLKKEISLEGLFFLALGFQFLIILLYYLAGNENDPFRFYLLGTITWVFASIILYRIGVFETLIKSEKLRKFVIEIVLLIPIISTAAGKMESEKIYQNIEYKYVNFKTKKHGKNSTEKLKLLGLTEKHFIFTNIQNSKVLFIKAESLDSLTVYEKKSQ